MSYLGKIGGTQVMLIQKEGKGNIRRGIKATRECLKRAKGLIGVRKGNLCKKLRRRRTQKEELGS